MRPYILGIYVAQYFLPPAGRVPQSQDDDVEILLPTFTRDSFALRNSLCSRSARRNATELSSPFSIRLVPAALAGTTLLFFFSSLLDLSRPRTALRISSRSQGASYRRHHRSSTLPNSKLRSFQTLDLDLGFPSILTFDEYWNRGRIEYPDDTISAAASECGRL